MTQQCNDLREHLLASLPQPENRAAYREETAALLAKHARALRWLKIAAITLLWVAVALTILTILWQGNYLHLGAYALHSVQVLSAVVFFTAGMAGVRSMIYESRIATLKEIKQVQLQVLELQRSLGKVNNA
ncbi:MAG: hypothetical protein WBP85_14570 [Terracidiphilus sp.]